MFRELPHRKRLERFEKPGRIRFITFSCQRRLPLLSTPAICQILLEAMSAARSTFALRIYAWVIMPEHVHLLVMPGETGLVSSLKSIKVSVAKRVIPRWEIMGAPILDRIMTSDGNTRFWQKGGGHDRNVRDTPEFHRKIRYIHLNPVERGLVGRADQWIWSSVRWWMGHRDGEFPCDPPPGDARSWSTWTGYV